MNEDVRCPYCNKQQEIVHDDGYGYAEDILHEQHCGDCDNVFDYETTITFSYEARMK